MRPRRLSSRQRQHTGELSIVTKKFGNEENISCHGRCKALRTYLKLSCDRPKYQFDHNLPVIFVVRNINSIEEALNLIARGSSFSINEVSDRINKDLFIFVARSNYGVDGCSLLESVIFAREKSKNINVFGLDYYLEKPIKVKGIIFALDLFRVDRLQIRQGNFKSLCFIHSGISSFFQPNVE